MTSSLWQQADDQKLQKNVSKHSNVTTITGNCAKKKAELRKVIHKYENAKYNTVKDLVAEKCNFLFEN